LGYNIGGGKNEDQSRSTTQVFKYTGVCKVVLFFLRIHIREVQYTLFDHNSRETRRLDLGATRGQDLGAAAATKAAARNI